jgi:hypothetical protein
MKPDFLCIGAQKSATTWLYAQLKKHPQVWVPPVKELNYFNSRSLTPLQRMFSRSWLGRRWRALCRKACADLISFKAGGKTRWFFRYLFLPRSFAWYCSLYPDNPQIVKGEFSPVYALLTGPVIEEIHSLMPNLKIIYLLRNPIYRSWSALKMVVAARGGKIEQMSIPDFCLSLKESTYVNHSDYLTNLGNWSRYFPREQIFVGFYDEVEEQPLVLIEKISEFLNLPFSSGRFGKTAARKFNRGREMEIPEQILPFLANLYLQDLESLREVFRNSYTENWLAFAKERAALSAITNHVR